QQQRAELVRLVRRLQALPLWEQTDERTRMQTQLAELLNAGVRPVVPELVNSIGMRFSLIPPGVYLMGSPEDEEERWDKEGPQHEVEISRPFYLGIFPVTQAQWQTTMGYNPSYFSAIGKGKDVVVELDTSDFPVERVNWEDAMAFLKSLSGLEEEREEGR